MAREGSRKAWWAEVDGLGLVRCAGPRAWAEEGVREIDAGAFGLAENARWSAGDRGGVEVMVLPPDEHEARWHALVLARVAPSLRLALRARPREMTDVLTRAAIGGALSIDSAFPDYAGAFADRLSAETRNAFFRLEKLARAVCILDACVAATLRASSVGGLTRALDDATCIARGVVEARRAAGPREQERTIAAAWGALAAARGHDFDAARLSVRAVERGIELSGQVVLGAAGALGTELRARLRRPLGATFTLRPESDRAWLGRLLRPDVRLGDAAADASLWIVGGPDDAVRDALPPAACDAALRVLLWASRVHVDGDALTAFASAVPQADGALASALDDVAALADAIAPPDAASPYR